MKHCNLRFAWGGHFDKLSKNGGVLKRAISKYQLDFGGPAPMESIPSSDGRGKMHILAAPFCLFEDVPGVVEIGNS